MKTSPKAAAPAASFLTLALLATATVSFAQSGPGNSGKAYGTATDPLTPVGSLTAFPTLVQTGTYPTLTWDIQYPEDISNIAEVDPGGTIVPDTDLCMEIRVIGGSYQVGIDDEGSPIYGYMQSQVAVQGVAGWTTFFYNTQKEILPTHAYAKAPVLRGQKVTFQARGYDLSGWQPFRSSGASDLTVLALVNGAVLPQTVAAFADGRYESFLKPYLDAGGHVRIGPKDILILFELDQTEIEAPGFDLQDLGLLATFDYCKNNNGHGNNLDGVDVSNPGNAPFPDSDPNYDDEATGGGSFESLLK